MPPLILFSTYHSPQPIVASNKGYLQDAYANFFMRLDFSTEVCSNTSAQMALQKLYLTAVSSSSRGYIGGGLDVLANPQVTTTNINGIRFDTEAGFTSAASLAASRYGSAGIQSSARGYWCGGYQLPGPVYLLDIDGIIFNTDTAVNPSAALSVATYWVAGVSSSVKGYISGGQTGGTKKTSYHCVVFATETTLAVSAALAVARTLHAGVASAAKGYFGGGSSASSAVSEIDGVNFSTDTTINPAAALSTNRSNLAGMNSNDKGYFAGGFLDTNWSGSSKQLDSFSFDTEAVAALGNALTRNTTYCAGMSAR